MKKKLLLSLLAITFSIFSFATHNQAGEILFKQMENSLEVEASIVTYTKITSIAADRDSLEICWDIGGPCEFVVRVNGPDADNNGIPDGVPFNADTKINIYTAVHTYPGLGNYTVSMTDPNRNAGILNVDFPNSENTPFIIQTEVSFFNSIFSSSIESPILLQAPIDIAFTGEPYMHSPNAFSTNGDSVAYELITPLGVGNYVSLAEITAGTNNSLDFNEETGLLIWDAPQGAGEYTIAYLIKFYRDGAQIGSVIRDMLIEVVEGPGFAPEIVMENISGNEEIIFVDLGDTVQLNITVEDQDINQFLEVSATCGLFDFYNDPASFSVDVDGSTATAAFKWIVREEHLREQAYQLVIRAIDDTPGHFKSSLAVVRYKTAFIPTSINDLAQLPGFELFPNPIQSGGILRINTMENQSWSGYYKIIGPLGQVIRERYNNSNGIGINELSAGIYFLWLENYRPVKFLVQ